jgi:proteasome lid subunit RPN8/RPN11
MNRVFPPDPPPVIRQGAPESFPSSQFSGRPPVAAVRVSSLTDPAWDVVLDEGVLPQIEGHARGTYPAESCGFLIGLRHEPRASRRRVVAAEPALNRFGGDLGRGFAIAPAEFREIELRLRNGVHQVVGIYHSHPDRPAGPSGLDQGQAWPWYTYLITAVTVDSVGPTRGFELAEDRGAFRPLDVRVQEIRASDGETAQTLCAQQPT